jgi:hypothetical protein
MDPIIGAVNLVDELVRALRYLRLTPTRAVRAEQEGFSLAFMQRLEWDIAGGWLLSRLARLAPCGCLWFRREYVAHDIDCPLHGPLDTTAPGPFDDDDDQLRLVDG